MLKRKYFGFIVMLMFFVLTFIDNVPTSAMHMKEIKENSSLNQNGIELEIDINESKINLINYQNRLEEKKINLKSYDKKMMSSRSNNALYTNTDPNFASIISVNTLINDYITQEGEQRWYAFSTSAGKITLNLNHAASTDVDYDVYLFSYDESNSSISLIGGSETAEIEHTAFLVNEGIYFVLVNGYSGSDLNNAYTLGTSYSSTFDSAEIDDAIVTASVIANINDFSITGTIDNAFDKDYKKIVVTREGRMSFSLSNNGSTNNIYRVDLYNGAGSPLGFINQGENGGINLSPGIYYFKVTTSTYGNDNISTYTLSGNFRSKASNVNITSAGNSFINYGYGQFWRVHGSTTVTGKAYDSNGNLLSNANIQIRVPVVLNNQLKVATGTTDSQGNFSVFLNLGNAVGNYVYNTSVSTHYYDIVPIVFLSNNEVIDSNIHNLYHFAYSM